MTPDELEQHLRDERELERDDHDHDHDHVWGELERSRLAGTVHRKCTVDGCRVIAIPLGDVDDDD